MYHERVLDLLSKLRSQGSIVELCPERGHWWYRIVRPEDIPSCLRPIRVEDRLYFFWK